LLFYCQLLEALLQTLTGSLPLDSAEDISLQTLKLLLCLPLRIICWTRRSLYGVLWVIITLT